MCSMLAALIFFKIQGRQHGTNIFFYLFRAIVGNTFSVACDLFHWSVSLVCRCVLPDMSTSRTESKSAINYVVM
jgi:hypothetical protein